jgi:hypothetical protein
MSSAKGTLIHLLLVASAFTSAMPLALAQDSLFDVKVSFPASVFAQGSPVQVDVTLINRTQRLLTFRDPRCGPRQAAITVRDDHQTELKPRDEWLRADVRLCGLGAGIDPGKRVTFALNIANGSTWSRRENTEYKWLQPAVNLVAQMKRGSRTSWKFRSLNARKHPSSHSSRQALVLEWAISNMDNSGVGQEFLQRGSV